MLMPMMFVLAFVIGLVAEFLTTLKPSFKSRPFFLRIERRNGQCARLASWYLIVHIGILGGVEMGHQTGVSLTKSIIPAVGISVLIFVVSYGLLEITKFFDRRINIAIATHFGSVSVGTFAASLALVEALQLSYSPIVFSWVALMELPAILIGVFLLGKGWHSILDVIRSDKGLLLLPFTLIVGACLPAGSMETGSLLKRILVDYFQPVLVYFLFDMGRHAYAGLSKMGSQRWKIIGSGIAIPLFAGTLGAGIARIVTPWNLGDVVIFATLAASASYVAAPIALRAVNQKSPFPASENQSLASIGLTIAVGITLPFNILFGIRIYVFEALIFQNTILAVGIVLALFISLVVGVSLRQNRFMHF